MKVRTRMLDVELTNRCNALCSFCPRAATPEQGFMTFETFKQVVARARELETPPSLTLTGQGESTLHTQLVEFVQHASSEGLEVQMTTNANLLDKEMSRRLLDAGLNSITFSVSDFGDDYNLVYNLDFEQTRANIIDFMALRDQVTDRRVGMVLSIVVHDLNKDKIDEMKDYWHKLGIKFVLEFPQNNRGGACDNGHYFIGNNRFESEARTILANRKASTICSAPFYFVFVGWSGQYYICCSDYKKETPLGSVFDFSIDDMDRIKLDSLIKWSNPACKNCNTDPVNAVREKLFEIEHKEGTQAELDEIVEHYAVVNNRRLPQDFDILQLKDLGAR